MTYEFTKGMIEENSSGKGKNPLPGGVAGGNAQADVEAHERSEWKANVPSNAHPPWDARMHESSEIANFMRDFMETDCQRCRQSMDGAFWKSSPDCNAVHYVVGDVSQQGHPTERFFRQQSTFEYFPTKPSDV